MWRAFSLVGSCRTIGAGGLGGFDWPAVGEVLRSWHEIETTPELHKGLTVCETELLKIDAQLRKERERKRRTESRSKGRRHRR